METTAQPVPGDGGVVVRPARLADVEAIAHIQSALWRRHYRRWLDEHQVADLDPATVATQWRVAVRQPPTPSHRVLVATSSGLVVGFAAIGPVTDRESPDDEPARASGTRSSAPALELLVLAVDDLHRAQGHGSRLLHAVVDIARGEGRRQVVAWMVAGDEAGRAFLQGAGFGPDGAYRDRGSTHGANRLRQVRLVTSLDQPGESSQGPT